MKNVAIKIAGMGLVSALGPGKETTASQLEAHKTALAPVSLFSTPLAETIPVSQVQDSWLAHPHQRNDALALVAIEEALAEAGLSAHSPELADCALLVGTISGINAEFEEEYRRYVDAPLEEIPLLVGPGAGRVALRLGRTLGLGGPHLTFCSACTSSAMALLQAFRLLQQGLCRRALVVGCDALNVTQLHGFSALMLLDPQGCRPFDAQRAGIQIGEGAAAVLLEARAPSAPEPPPPTRYSQAPPKGEGPSLEAGEDPLLAEEQLWLLGGASLCDPYHMTASSPDGSGGLAVMERACRQAGVDPAAIVAVKTHGTGSRDNDQAEAQALRRFFPQGIPPFTSLKRYLGHTMGAAGLVEMVSFLACLRRGFVPACAGFSQTDPDLNLLPLRQHHPLTTGISLFNYFGFGGSCVSFLVERQQQQEKSPLSPQDPWQIASGEGQEEKEEQWRRDVERAPSPANTLLSAFALPVAPVAKEALAGLQCQDLHRLEKEILPQRIRRIGRHIRLSLLGAVACLQRFAGALDLERLGIFLGTALGPASEIIRVVQQITPRMDRFPSPIQFANTVSNSSTFYVAKVIEARGTNLTTSQEDFSFEAACFAAQQSLHAGLLDYALVGGVDENVVPRDQLLQQLSYPDNVRLGEGSAWWLLASPHTATSLSPSPGKPEDVGPKDRPSPQAATSLPPSPPKDPNTATKTLSSLPLSPSVEGIFFLPPEQPTDNKKQLSWQQKTIHLVEERRSNSKEPLCLVPGLRLSKEELRPLLQHWPQATTDSYLEETGWYPTASVAGLSRLLYDKLQPGLTLHLAQNALGHIALLLLRLHEAPSSPPNTS